MKRKVLIPADAILDLQKLRAALKNYAQDDIRIMALTYDVMDQLERAEIPHEFRERALKTDALFEVNDFATRLARQWHQSNALKERMTYRGVNVGQTVELDLLYAANVALDRWLNIRELVIAWKPDLILNLYPRKALTQLRVLHHESLIPQVMEMIALEIPALAILSENCADMPKAKTPCFSAKIPSNLRTVFENCVVHLALNFRDVMVRILGPSQKSNPKILFYSGWWYFLPAIQHLARSHKVIPWLMQCRFGAKLLRRSWFMPVYFKILKAPTLPESPSGKQNDWESGQRLLRENETAALFRFSDHDIWPLVKERFMFLWKQQWDAWLPLISAMHLALEQIRPGLVITENDSTVMERTLVQVANHRGIPTLVLQHGMTSGGESGKSTRTYVDHGFFPLHASGIAVYGAITRDLFVTKGVSPARIHMTGCPRFDEHFLRKDYPERKAFYAALGIPPEKKVVVYANTPGYKNGYSTEYHLRFQEIEALTASIVRTIGQIPGTHLIIKMKDVSMKDRIDIIERHLGGFPENVSVVYDVDIPALLYHTDLFVGSWSTMCLEALIFDKPVLTVNLTGRPDPMPFAEMGAAVGIYTEADMLPIFRRMIFDETFRQANAPARQKFVQNYLCSYHGDGKERFTALALAMARGCKPTARSIEPPANLESVT